MKAGEFANLLRESARVTGRHSLDRIASQFEHSPSATVAATLKRVSREPESPFWRTDAATDLAFLRPLIVAVARISVVKDVDATISTIERGPTTSASTFRSRRGTNRASSDGLVAEYVSSLTAALGNTSRFPLVYDRLASDSRLGAADYRSIAREFAKSAPKTKADALKKIWARHQSLLLFDAKARATDGRSAA